MSKSVFFEVLPSGIVFIDFSRMALEAEHIKSLHDGLLPILEKRDPSSVLFLVNAHGGKHTYSSIEGFVSLLMLTRKYAKAVAVSGLNAVEFCFYQAVLIFVKKDHIPHNYTNLLTDGIKWLTDQNK